MKGKKKFEFHNRRDMKQHEALNIHPWMYITDAFNASHYYNYNKPKLSKQGLDIHNPTSLTPAKWHHFLWWCGVGWDYVNSALVHTFTVITAPRFDILSVSVFGFFILQFSWKCGHRKGRRPWRFCLEMMMVCVNWERLQRRSRPWVLKQVEGFSFFFSHYYVPVTPRPPAQATEACSGVLNKPKKRSTLVEKYIQCTWRALPEDGVLREVLTQGQKCWSLPQRSGVSRITWCRTDTVEDPDG